MHVKNPNKYVLNILNTCGCYRDCNRWNEGGGDWMKNNWENSMQHVVECRHFSSIWW